MKTLLMLAAVLGIAACGDDKDAPPLGHTAPDGGAAPAGSFDAFVIDLIDNHTDDKSAPVAVDFSSSDSQSDDEFSSLFN